MTANIYFRQRTTFIRPSDATQYTAGDEISSSATAGSVVLATFDLTGFTRGRIYACAVDITAASSTVVTAASDMEVLIFKTPDAPAAGGDNVALSIAAAVRTLAVAQFRLDDTGWTGPLGTVAAGASQIQGVMATLVQPLATNVPQYPHVPGFPFDFTGQTLAQRQFTLVMRALAAWNPGAVANTIGVTLDFEAS